MKIPGIAYIIIGVFIAVLSGYVYKFIPRTDGTPNMAMALFFFIGIIFLIIGFIKLFFKRAEDAQESEYHKTRKVVEKVVGQNIPEQQRRNRVEEQLNNAVQNQNQYTNTQNSHHQTQHTNGYAKTHPYHGAQQETTQGARQQTQHPLNHHASSTSALSIVACKRCGDKNSAVANYCHSCGFRLR